jgi:hypothetical protein
VLFDQTMLIGECRRQARRRREQDVALQRDIAFALAVADLLDLPDDLPLLPVSAVMTLPMCLRDPASLAHLKKVAHSAARRAHEPARGPSSRSCPPKVAIARRVQ